MPVVIDGVRNATGGIRVETVDVVLEVVRRRFPSACKAFELGGGSIVGQPWTWALCQTVTEEGMQSCVWSNDGEKKGPMQ